MMPWCLCRLFGRNEEYCLRHLPPFSKWIEPRRSILPAARSTIPSTLRRGRRVGMGMCWAIRWGRWDPSGMDATDSGVQNGACPASQQTCPTGNPPPRTGPLVPNESDSAEANYVTQVMVPGYLSGSILSIPTLSKLAALQGARAIGFSTETEILILRCYLRNRSA